MKKFKFKYEKILKIRRDLVEDIKNRLSKLNYDLSVKNKEIETVIHERNLFFAENNNLMKKGCSISQLKNNNEFVSFYRRKIDSLQLEINGIQRKIDSTIFELSEAVKEEKIMEKLKEKDFNNYLEEIEKNENKIIEEIVNYSNFKDRR